MACFIVPAVEAVVVTAAAKALQSQEKKSATATENSGAALETKLAFSEKLKWLSYLLWGGAVLLAFEHVWHGEVVPWFPFLTAASNPADTAEMLHEMATVGVAMAVLVTVVWVGMVLISNAIEKRALTAQTAPNLGISA